VILVSLHNYYVLFEKSKIYLFIKILKIIIPKKYAEVKGFFGI